VQDNGLLISVIIPVFNRFDEANRAVNSVVNQTYRSWELIIIDDNSASPYSIPVMNATTNGKITLLRNEKNIGPGLSRQRALEIANGSFVCFLDSDDYYDPEFLSKSIHIHKLNPSIAATYTAAVYIQTGQIREGSDQSYQYIMPTLFEQHRPWPTCAWLWNKSSVATWKSLRTNQDSLFELDCCFINNNIRHIPEVLCYIDKGTGQNTADLVKARASDKHRNVVALHALKNRHKIQVHTSDQDRLNQAIKNRVMYVSSKLAGHGYGLAIIKNGVNLFPVSIQAGLLLLILGLPTLLPIGSIRNLSKRAIAKYSR